MPMNLKPVIDVPNDGWNYVRRYASWIKDTIRRKTEVVYQDLNIVMTQDVQYNLVNLIKNLTPTTGTLAPFFDTTANKLRAYNNNTTMTFKLSLDGQFSGATSNRSLLIDFLGTNGNSLVVNRPVGIDIDRITFALFFSIDANGNIATNGTEVVLTALGSSYTISKILLIAEQTTNLDTIGV